MAEFRRVLVAIVLAIACVLFVIFLVQAFTMTRDRADTAKEAPLKEFPAKFMVVVGGALAVNLGTVLGIQLKQGPRSWSSKGIGEWWGKLKADQKLQIVLASVYFLSLCLALAFWWADGWSETTTAPIPDLAWTLLGVILGVTTSLSQE